MILILSAHFDQSTNDVIDWLCYYKAPFVRVDGESYLNSELNFKVMLSDNGIELSLGNILLNNLTSVWNRRWIPYNFSFNDELKKFEDVDIGVLANIKNNVIIEMRKSCKLLFDFLQTKNIKSLPFFNAIAIDKVTVLKTAASVGLKIPESIICNNKNDVLRFYEKHKKIITKPLGEAMSFSGKSHNYINKTVIIEECFLEQIEERFFPSLFQKYIEKEIEIRSFFIEGKFYSMAIFSQLDKKTSVDFRNYNDLHPNRNIPFKLPEEVEKRIDNLMSILNLNTGSVDIILTPDNDFVFLEVNPIGQFGMTSYPCNYYLEKEIAKSLIVNFNEQ
ncbi:MAG: grasp-with-spasm system ATP-grasp peptide maturase [Flavobacterium sp.]|nr:grasp-with-spasm system ATP-grasp peptide maturase [Flavobacterium sp.]